MSTPWTNADTIALLKKLEAAPTEQSLLLYAEQAKDVRIPETDRGLMREIYAARLKMIRTAERLGYK